MITKIKLRIILNIVLIAFFIGLVTYMSIKYGPGITNLVKKTNRFKEFIDSYGPISIFVYIFFQVLQVIIAPIPGELIQLAGGYIFGTFLSTLYSLLGIFIGSVLVFYISRLLGYSLIKSIIKAKELDRLKLLINSPKSEITVFLLFLIPGIPKDVLVYIAGLTPVKPIKFFTIYLIARFPGILATSFMGARIKEQNFLPVIILFTIACILFLIGILNKNKIINRLHRYLYTQKPS